MNSFKVFGPACLLLSLCSCDRATYTISLQPAGQSILSGAKLPIVADITRNGSANTATTAYFKSSNAGCGDVSPRSAITSWWTGQASTVFTAKSVVANCSAIVTGTAGTATDTSTILVLAPQ